MEIVLLAGVERIPVLLRVEWPLPWGRECLHRTAYQGGSLEDRLDSEDSRIEPAPSFGR